MSQPISSLCEEVTFSKVFQSYSKTLFNFLYYKCGDDNLAQDLVQEAFMKLWQNTFQHNKVKLKFANLNHKGHTNESPEFLMLEKEHMQKLNDGISNLPEKQRVVFLLSRIDKKTYKEIGEIIGISKQAVEKRIYLALDTLRKINKKIK